MSLLSKLQKPKSLHRQIKNPCVSYVNQSTAVIDTVGMIEECLLFPGDRLRLGAEQEGDLLLLEANHPSLKVLYPDLLFARRYGEFVILCTPHQPTINIEQWKIIGAVKGLERSLERATLGIDSWWVKIHGVEGVLAREWVSYIESVPLPPEYLSELTYELSAIDGASVQASWTQEGLENAIVPTPDKIVFSMHKLETASGFVSSWAVASKRQLRRKRQRRRQPRSEAALRPVPECHRFLAETARISMLSKGLHHSRLASK